MNLQDPANNPQNSLYFADIWQKIRMNFNKSD